MSVRTRFLAAGVVAMMAAGCGMEQQELMQQEPSVAEESVGQVAEALSTNTVYSPLLRRTGKAVGVIYNSTASGAELHQWDRWQNQTFDWRLTSNSDGTWTLRNTFNNLSLCMSPQGSSTAAGARMAQITCSSTNDSQRFYLDNMGSGYYRLRNKRSNLCVNLISVWGLQNGALLEQNGCSSSDLQQFYFSGVGDTWLRNGSFEEGVAISTANKTIGVGSTDLTNWSVVSGNVDIVLTDWTHLAGARSIDLNGTQPGAITTTTPTTVGRTYVVEFGFAGNMITAPAIKSMSVSATGNPAQTYTFDTTGKSLSNMGWTRQTYTFKATATTTTLRFSSTTSNSWSGPVIDDVQIRHSY